MTTFVESVPMQATLESEISTLLNDLLAGQNELLAILGRKRRLLAASDHQGLTALGVEEERLLGVLQSCMQRRQELLARAGAEGLPATSIEALAQALPSAQRTPITRQIATAASRTRLLHTQNLTNWVVIQRTLIHLSQLLEIIATGGRLQPTYGDCVHSDAHGALVDQEA